MKLLLPIQVSTFNSTYSLESSLRQPKGQVTVPGSHIQRMTEEGLPATKASSSSIASHYLL